MRIPCGCCVRPRDALWYRKEPFHAGRSLESGVEFITVPAVGPVGSLDEQIIAPRICSEAATDGHTVDLRTHIFRSIGIFEANNRSELKSFLRRGQRPGPGVHPGVHRIACCSVNQQKQSLTQYLRGQHAHQKIKVNSACSIFRMSCTNPRGGPVEYLSRLQRYIFSSFAVDGVVSGNS